MSNSKLSGSTLLLTVSLLLFVATIGGGGLWWHSRTSSVTHPLTSPKKVGSLTLQNSTPTAFTLSSTRKPTGRAKALSTSSGVVLPPALVFAPSQGKASKVMDLYLDLSSAPSRDFLLTEQTSLKSWIEEGRLTLRIHPLLSSDPLTLYCFNGVSELAVKDPTKGWQGLLLLTKEAPAWSHQRREEQVATVGSLLQELSPAVTPSLVAQGEFVEWLSLSGRDKRLTSLSALPLPLIYLNDRLLTPTTGNLDDSGVLRKEVLD